MTEPDCRLEKDAALLNTAVHLLSHYVGIKAVKGRIGDERAAIRRAKAILDADLDRKLTREEAARSVGFSRYHFLKVLEEPCRQSTTGFPGLI